MAGLNEPSAPPEVALTENPESVAYSYWAPKTNPAIQLATSLQDLRPQLQEFTLREAAFQETKANEASKQAAIKTMGEDFAQAVREGKIEPTQNPWFIQAYHRNAAQVATENFTAQLNTDAASWSEQNDPKAFQQKYASALSEFGKKFDHPDQQEGFNASAAPALQQAIAQNQAYNVERIKVERQQDLSSLAGKAIMDSIRKAGGRSDPELVQNAISPMKRQWLGTGGTITDWNKVVIGAIEDAAFNTQDPNILDLAKKIPNSAGGSLYDMEGVAREIEQGRYRIMGEQRDRYRMSLQEQEFNILNNTLKAEGLLFDKYGPGIYSGKFDEQGAITTLTGQGFKSPEIAKAFQSIAQTGNSIRELAADRFSSYSTSPEGATALSSMYGEAQRSGWSEGLENELGMHLLRGEISDQTATDIRGKALSRTNAQAVADPLKQQQAVTRRAQVIQKWTNARDLAVKAADKSEVRYRQFGGPALAPSDQDNLHEAIITAVSDFMEAQPRAPLGVDAQGKPQGSSGKKVIGVNQIAIDAANAWWSTHLAKQPEEQH